MKEQMMSKERELLQAIILKVDGLEGFGIMNIIKESKELLAQPEQEQEQEPEPVVWMSCEPSTGLVYFENSGKMEHGWIPLYMAPPAPEPLSDEEIAHGAKMQKADIFGTLILNAFVSGLKYAEKAHGIRGGK